MLKATRSPVAFELLSFTGWTFVKGSHLPHKYGYLHMCRFFSSKIWFHPATAHFRYIMRLDPHSFIASPLVPDPFIQMSIEKKRYAITFLWVERIDYSSGFLDLTWNFSRKHNFTIPPLFFNLFVGTNREYNQFQLYNNFFLADTEFFRKSDVLQYLRFVDQAGGHYTVRWGDSLVHSFVLGFLQSSTHHTCIENEPEALDSTNTGKRTGTKQRDKDGQQISNIANKRNRKLMSR
jgi:hypothetical protein